MERPLAASLPVRIAMVLAALAAFPGCGSDDEGGGSESRDTAVNPADASALCVKLINDKRASLDLAPYERWAGQEDCSASEAKSDSETGEAHGAFGKCGEMAQNECPGWMGEPKEMIGGCLDVMWSEGPGEDFQAHGHYINMSSKNYTKVACGFYKTASGSTWSVQNFQ